jgi:hypothetical protein
VDKVGRQSAKKVRDTIQPHIWNKANISKPKQNLYFIEPSEIVLSSATTTLHPITPTHKIVLTVPCRLLHQAPSLQVKRQQRSFGIPEFLDARHSLPE